MVRTTSSPGRWERASGVTWSAAASSIDASTPLPCGSLSRFHSVGQPQRPRLGDKVLFAKAVVPLLPDEREAGLFVDAPRRMELALRPERKCPIAGRPCETDAFVDQRPADAQPTCTRFDQQQS